MQSAVPDDPPADSADADAQCDAEQPPADHASPGSRGTRCPRWLLVAVLLLLALAHTQLTMRQMLLVATGVYTGEAAATKVQAGAEPGTAVLRDPFAVFPPDKLAGDRVHFGEQRFPITANTPRELTLAAEPEAVRSAIREHEGYVTGFTTAGPLQALALRMPGANVTAADLLLGLTFLALLLYLGLRRDWDRRVLPPLGIWLLLLVGTWSVVGWARPLDAWYGEELAGDPAARAAAWRAGIKELVQYAAVLLGGYMVFAAAFRDPRARRWAYVALLVVGGLSVLVAWGEYAAVSRGSTLRGLADTMSVDGLFGVRHNPTRADATGSESSRNVLGLYLAWLLPLGLATLAAPWPWYARAGGVLLAALGLGVVLHAGLLVAAIVGCLVVAATWARAWAVHTTALGALLVLLTVALAVQALSVHDYPNQHGVVLMDSVALHRHADVTGLQPMPLTGRGGEDYRQWNPWQEKYVEMQAALNVFSFSPLLGHGLGRYQKVIGAGYSDSRLPSLRWIQEEPANYMEGNAHSLYQVLAVETGALGVLALLALLIGALRAALPRLAAGGPLRYQAMGVTGALVALGLGTCFGSFMVRGLAVLTVALLALATTPPDPPTEIAATDNTAADPDAAAA